MSEDTANQEVVEQQPDTGKTFSEDYVRELRQEAASYRVKAKEVETQFNELRSQLEERDKSSKREQAESLASSLGMVDPTILNSLLGDDLYSDDLEDKINNLLEEKPYLKGKPSVGRASNPVSNESKPQLFTREQLQGMSQEDINRNWETISLQLQNQTI